MKFIPLEFSPRNFRIGEIAQFSADACHIVKQRTPTGIGQQLIETKRMALEQISNGLDISLGIDRKSQVTKTIEEIDSDRDRYFSGMRIACKGFLFYHDTAVAGAASHLLDFMQHFGDINDLPYPDQTAKLRAFIGAIHSDSALTASAALVPGIVPWLQALQASNDQFENQYAARVQQQATLPDGAIATWRKPAVDAWAELQLMINAFASADKDGSYDVLYRELDELIRQYRNIYARRNGNKGDEQAGS